MRLSDAVAMGRTLRKPAPGDLGNSEEGCAMGMALAACGKRPMYGYIEILWPWATDQNDFRKCPVCNERYRNVSHMVQHCFDSHVWTREMTLDQLIDWVRSVEPAESEAAEQISIQEFVPCAAK